MAPNPSPNADNPDKFISILHRLLPQKLETLLWIKEPEQAIFLAPPVFSRMDAPQVFDGKPGIRFTIITSI